MRNTKARGSVDGLVRTETILKKRLQSRQRTSFNAAEMAVPKILHQMLCTAASDMDDFAWGAKLTPPRVVSLGSDLSKGALIIKMYQVTCILIYLLEEHIHVTTSIKQHIHALFCVYVCYNEY